MTQIAFAIICGLFFFCHTAFSQTDQDFEYTFRIKLAASKTAIPKSAKIYKDFSDVDGVQFPDGYIRYFIGRYETFHEAKDRMENVKAKGYKDAYIICIHKGKILTVDQAISAIYEGEE